MDFYVNLRDKYFISYKNKCIIKKTGCRSSRAIDVLHLHYSIKVAADSKVNNFLKKVFVGKLYTIVD